MDEIKTGFAGWWARRADPTLLHDERVILAAIAPQLSELVNLPGDRIDPETAEHAAAHVTRLDIVDCLGDTFSSLEPLPRILNAPLRELAVHTPTLRDLTGVEAFPTLTSLSASDARLTSIAALAELKALDTLDIRANQIDSLAPLGAATGLKQLHCAGNRIDTLAPLRGHAGLELLTIGGGVAEMKIDDRLIRPFRLLDNPIDDAGMLADHPLLGNILTRVDLIDMLFYHVATGKLMIRTTANRVGRSNRFIAPLNSAPAMTVTVCAMSLLPRAGVDRLLVALHLAHLNGAPFASGDAVALAVLDTPDRGTATMPENAPLIDDATSAWVAGPMGMGREPVLLLECRRHLPFQ
ncbi:leucine-rich repeat domain-containing protein [Duganella callida]|uniref:Leucine-rich repeat domain-containing protein n=1 Tax=Duganella callida TaxID=2561932 RepID=A0A4Y9RZU4_9BURK|nr:leucine-rich repeat domain-containing protein [Duganella callida]TFW13265.1 leucine-rich repeat domain-containing protein [Duganella callida]